MSSSSALSVAAPRRSAAAAAAVVVDEALGAGIASGVLNETKRRWRDELWLETPARYAPSIPEAVVAALYAVTPASGFGSAHALACGERGGRRSPTLAHAIRALGGMHAALGDAEVRLRPLSRRPDGVRGGPAGALLSVGGFNGTRYAPTARCRPSSSRLSGTRWPSRRGAGRGGGCASRRRATASRCGGSRADRLVLFHAELAHEVLPSHGRASLSAWNSAEVRGAAATPAVRPWLEQVHEHNVPGGGEA